MTLIIQDIEESDEFMVELTKIFLAALKKGNKVIALILLDLFLLISVYPTIS